MTTSNLSTAAPNPSQLPPRGGPALVEVLRYLRDPEGYCAARLRRDGDPFCVASLNGDVVITNHPDSIRQVYALSDDEYYLWQAELIAGIVGKGSVLALEGDAHKRERRLLNPPFHGQRMRAYGRLMRELTHQVMRACPLGEELDARRAMQSISLRVILRAVFGVSEPERVQRFEEASLRFMARANHPMSFFPFLRKEFGGIGPWAEFRKAWTHFTALLAEQRQLAAQSPAQEDILSLLVNARYDDGSRMSDDQIRDELITLLIAGHETTATSLSWALYALHGQPALLGRLREELVRKGLGPDADPEQVAGNAYLEAVCNETLRRYPIVAEVFRRIKAPLTLGRYTLPAGTSVATSILMLHKRHDLYPQPEVFRPERFLERRFTPWEFAPFGGGSRRCVGAAFALYEMKIVLHALLTGYELSLATTKPIQPVMYGLTMGPKGGVPIRITAHRNGQ